MPLGCWKNYFTRMRRMLDQLRLSEDLINTKFE